MTPVLFHFVTPEGDPVANTDFEIQLTRSSYDMEVDGVLLPRLLTATTDEDGRATVDLWVNPAPYVVTLLDPTTEAGLSYQFLVPDTEDGTPLRLQDLVVEGSLPTLPYDESTLLVLQEAKAITLTHMVAAGASEDAAAASEATASTASATAVSAATDAEAARDVALAQASLATTAASDASDLVDGLVSLTAAVDAAEASEAAAAASQAAAESAEVDALSGARVYTTSALGITGTTNGQEFRVLQGFGEGHEVYRNNAGAALWLKARAAADLALTMVVERYYPQVIAPVAEMFSHHTLTQNARGANNAARWNAKVLSRNLCGFPHGIRNQGSGPTTVPYGGDGPVGGAGNLLATTIDYATTAQLFSFWVTASRPPAGTYTVRFRITSNDANTYAMRYGASTPAPGYSTVSAQPGVWTTCEKEITTDGSTNWSAFALLGDGTNTPKVRIDEVQIYNDTAANVPAFSTEVHGDDFVHPYAWPVTRHINRALDLTTSSALGAGIFRLKNWPAVTHFSAITMIAVAAMDAYQTNQQLISTDYNAALGTTNSTLATVSAQNDGALDFGGITSLFAHDLVGQGFHVAGLRVKDGQRIGSIDTWEAATGTNAFTGFDARLMRVGANGTSETNAQTTFRWNGKICHAKVFDRFLTDEQYAIEVETIKGKLQAAGIQMGDMPTVTILLGDSQTASFSGSRGPSWGVLQATAGRHTPNMPVRNLAIGGYTTQMIVSDQLPIALRMIPQITRNAGRRAVVAMYIGTNNQQELVDDWNNGVSSFTSPTGWWQTVRSTLIQPLLDAGARVAIGTLLPDGGSPPVNFEPARVAWNTALKATAGIAVMDFASDPVMGNVANNTGANWDPDHRHCSTLGHTVLAPYAATGIAAAALMA